MKGNLKEKNGITLIALVITIIVMLILVAVTISMAVNGGLFTHAGKATRDMKNAQLQENELSKGRIKIDGIWYDSIDDYMNERPSANQEDGPTNEEGEIENDGETFSAIYGSTQDYLENGVKTAVIPKGFRVGTSEGINKVEDGLVIQDAEGNQFVWIPVNYTATGSKDSHGLDSGFLSVFKRSTTSTSYTEPYASGYTEESNEYYDMMLSVQTNHGFYVGRYEAGTTEPRLYNQANGTSAVCVVKRDMYPYNNVGWGSTMNNYTDDVIDQANNNYNQGKGAVALSKAFYPSTNNNIGVISTLCYGVQWDAMINFIKEGTSYNTDTNSSAWGNYMNHEFTITRGNYAIWNDDECDYIWNSENLLLTETNTYTKENEMDVLLTTGASEDNKAKNIYDVAGNCFERTMEADYTGYRVERRRQLLLRWLWQSSCR